MNRLVLFAIGVLLPAVPASAATVSNPDPGDRVDQAAELADARARWAAKGIEDYTTYVRVRCFCPREPRIATVVRGGEVRRVSQGPRRLPRSQGMSVDALYALVEESLATDDATTATYSVRGIPKEIGTNPEELTIDEERYYSVRLVRD